MDAHLWNEVTKRDFDGNGSKECALHMIAPFSDNNIMIQIREIDHVVLRISDLESMLRFYCDVLGCKVERRQEELGLTQLRAGRSLIDLVTVDGELGLAGGSPPGPEGRNMDHLCLRIDPFDAEALYAHLNRHGIKAGEIGSRYGAEGEGPSLYLNDPEGNVVELKGAPWSR